MAPKDPLNAPTVASDKNLRPPLRSLPPRFFADGPVRLTLACAAVAVGFILLPLPPQVEQVFSADQFLLLFQLLILLALRRDLGRIDSPVERQFWNDLTAAHCCWLAASLIIVWFSRPFSQAVNLTLDCLYSLYYLALVLAIERRVHRLHPWRPTRLERALSWPGAALFVLGLLIYCVLIPELRDSHNEGSLPSYILYLSLDLYIAMTFLYLALTSAAHRWRAIYLGLGAAYGAVLATDFLEMTLSQWPGNLHWKSATDVLWFFPSILLVVAVRKRHQRFPPPDSESVLRARAEQNLSGPSGRTMVTALAFPFLHFLCFRLGVLEEHRDIRELVVLLWIFLLASIAAFQHRMLRHRLLKLQSEREEFEASLRSGEQDLRLFVERSHSQQQIRETEQKFTKAFHANPDAMALSTREDGRVLEVNTTFMKISGFQSEEILNRKATEIGMWGSSENRRRMLQEVKQNGRIVDAKTQVPQPSGQTRTVSLSVEPLEIDGEPCLLSVFQPLPDHDPDRQAELWNDSEAAIAMLDGKGLIVYWNNTAVALYGWSREEALGRPAAQLYLVESPNTLAEIRQRLASNGSCCCEMTHRTHNNQTVEMETWWSQVDAPQTDRQDGRRGLLCFGFQSEASKRPSELHP